MNLKGLTNSVKEGAGSVNNLFSKTVAEGLPTTGSLGVDIGSSAVKVARLEGSKENCKVLGFGIEKIIDKNLRDALSKALVKAKASPEQRAVLSVAGQGVVSRYIEIPMMSKAELESSMKFEIEKYVPFAMAEVVSDYAVIQEMKDKAKMSVLVAAAKNELIQKKCNLAREVNLNLKAIDLDCIALANFFVEIADTSKKGTCVGIIDIGKSVSNINILVEGMPHLSRDIFIGGDDVTKKMSEVLELDYTEAEALKINPQSRLDELLTIWDPVLNNLSAEIRVSLDYFEARNNKAVEKIFITGGTSRLAGIEEYFKHLLAIEIEKLDYADHLKFDPSVNKDEFKGQGDLLAIALGLALR